MLLCERMVRLLNILAVVSRKKPVSIERHVLHFLATVPLVYGARSLEFLVSLLKPGGDPERLELRSEALLSAGLSRHARMAYGPPEKFWRRFCRTNRISIDQRSGDQVMKLLFE